MTLQMHLKAGLIGGMVAFGGSRRLSVAVCFVIGSVFIDFDHLWQYWRMNNFKKPFSMKRFFQFNDMLTEKFFGGAFRD